MPSMTEAAKIRDVAARHAYAFNNGLSSPDFFDVEKRMKSEEFSVLSSRIKPEWDVIEIGCYTGLNLIGLSKLGHRGHCVGVDFVQGAIDWLEANWPGEPPDLTAHCREFPNNFPILPGLFDAAICFDVLEHQRNAGEFLKGVSRLLKPNGTALILVPKGREYYDCGHVGFFPDEECLTNVLDYVFDVEECFELASCKKLFAVCRKRGE